jgi:hypothetical protein
MYIHVTGSNWGSFPAGQIGFIPLGHGVQKGGVFYRFRKNAYPIKTA